MADTTPAARPVRYKQPGEARSITLDFGTKLAAGDTISSVTLTADEGVVTTTPQLENGRLVTTRVSGGVADSDYVLHALASTTMGDTLALDLVVAVREGVN